MSNTRVCPQCGAEFTGRSDKIYCSVRCKSAATANADLSSQLQDSPIMHQQPMRASKRTSDSISPNQQVQLTKLDFEHRLQMKRFEAEEAEKDRNHEVHQLRRQLIEERRIMAERMLALQRQFRQLTGQSMRDLPDADEIDDLEDLLELASLPVPPAAPKIEPLPTVPAHLVEEAKDIFKKLLEKEESEEWNRADLKDLLPDVEDVIKQLERWQQANPRVSLHNQLVYELLTKVKATFDSAIRRLGIRSSVWHEASMELSLDRSFDRALRRFPAQ